MKVAVIGAGSVGTAVAYASVIRGVAHEIALFDVDGPKATAEVLDLRDGLQFVGPARVDGGDDPAVCAGADVIVMTAGAKQEPGQTRLELAAANAELVRSAVPVLLEQAPDALILVVTNPVDVITFVAQEVSGLAPGRVFGSGTVLDTARLRLLLADRLHVAVTSVHATVVGEHGDSAVVLWSTADIGGVPIDDVVGSTGAVVGRDEHEAVLAEVRGAAYRIIEGKGATNLAIGLATAQILRCIENDERAVLPVSVRTTVDGVGEVCCALPTIVGRAGVLTTLATPMSDQERAGLQASARAIRDVIDTLV
jgi:L-lactate dehydrogenase